MSKVYFNASKKVIAGVVSEPGDGLDYGYSLKVNISMASMKT